MPGWWRSVSEVVEKMERTLECQQCGKLPNECQCPKWSPEARNDEVWVKTKLKAVENIWFVLQPFNERDRKLIWRMVLELQQSDEAETKEVEDL